MQLRLTRLVLVKELQIWEGSANIFSNLGHLREFCLTLPEILVY